MSLGNEIIRKGIHLCCVVIPLAYFILDRKMMLVFLSLLLLIAFGVEWARFRSARFAKRFNSLPGKLLRDHEKRTWTGSTFLLLGAFLAILLFERWIAIVVLLFLVVADALGAIAGRFWGGRRLWGSKTVVGSAVFLAAAGLMVFIVPGANIAIGLVGGVVAFLMEVFVTRIDDNLTIPLGAGGTMQILTWMMGGG